MKIKYCIILVSVLFVNGVQGKDGIEFLQNSGYFTAVTVTSTNLTLKFHSIGSGLMINRPEGFSRIRPLEYDKEFTLTPDRVTVLSSFHYTLLFTPVSYKNQHAGFRITEFIDHHSFGGGEFINYMYLALSDTPIEVGEDDVDTIMEMDMRLSGWQRTENGEWEMEPVEWKPYVKSPSASEPETPEEPPPVITEGEDTSPPPVIASISAKQSSPTDEQGKSVCLWLYGIIALIICAVLYLFHRKLTTHH